MFGPFTGNDLDEWCRHFKLTENCLKVLRENFEAGSVEDLIFVYGDVDLLKELEKGCSKIDYRKFLDAKKHTEILKNLPEIPSASSSVMSSGPAPASADLLPPCAPDYKIGSLASMGMVAMAAPHVPAPSHYHLFPPQVSMARLEADRQLAKQQKLIDEKKRELELIKRQIKHRQRRAHKRSKLIKERLIQIRELEDQIRHAASLDVLFLVDCTGSMNPYINKVKTKIKEFVADIIKMHTSVSLRLGFVGYRDHYNERKGEKRLEVLRFTTDVDEFYKQVQEVKAIYNDDDAEDVLGGFHLAKNLEWVSKTRIIYHIADAPCHGSEYHVPTLSDKYPEGCPNGLKADEIILAILQLGITYYFGQIKPESTEIMINKFNEYVRNYHLANNNNEAAEFPYIKVTDMNDGNMMEIITKSVSMSFSETLSSSSRTPDENKGAKKQVKINKNRPNWCDIEEEEVQQFSMFMPDSIDAMLSYLEENDEDKCINDFPDKDHLFLKVAPFPFGQGSSRAAFYALQVTRSATGTIVETPVIVKESLYVNPSHLTKQKYENYLSCHRAAKFLAEEFNRVKPRDCSKIEFVTASILQFNTRKGQPYLILESAIDDEFEKYNNNNGYCNQNPTPGGVKHDAIQAFSHWTYCFSREQMIVVDCQGGYNRSTDTFNLSDPAVHHVDATHFGSTNLGQVGINKFFSNHVCNSVCAAMGLRAVAVSVPASSTSASVSSVVGGNPVTASKFGSAEIVDSTLLITAKTSP
eukprot:gene2113-2254_t